MIADTQSASAQRHFDEWQSQQRVPDEPEWQKAYVFINRALKLDPTNPIYLEKITELYRWKSLFPGITPEARESSNRSVLSYYRQLLQLKPSWPNYWAGLVQTKFALWEFDGEMQQALQNAAHYGPWFKNNQRTILSVGYQTWFYLDEKTQQIVNTTLDRAIKIQPQETIQLAFDVGFTDQIMPYLESDKGLMHRYKRELAERKKNL